MKLNNIVKIAVVLLVLIGVVFYINKAPQKIKVAEANKTAPERVSALNYKGSMVIQKVTNIEDIMAELNNEPTAGSGTFDPAMIASEITAELTKAFSDSKEHSLPLVANWNVGLPVYEDGLDPMYMMSRLEMGEHVLVSWKLDPYYNDNVDISYYEDSIKKAATLKLPLVFVVDAPESALYKDDFYSGLPKERNPNVITNDGDVLAKLSPFAPSDVWKEVGEQWSSTNLMQQIQEWYPNPPMVLFVSKDEATKLAWSEVSLASRYTLENKDDNFKRTLIDAEWVEKYRQMYEGFKAGFVQTSWKENTKFISFNRLSEKMGATQNWDENATYTNYYTNIWPLTADGLSVDFTLGGESSDVSGDAPHIYANNLPFMLQEAKTVNSGFAYQLNLDAKGKIDDPVRYRGFSQFALWFLRPSIIRQATQETQKDAIEPTFKEIIDSAELIHYNAQLADFWRNGELVRNGASDLNRAIPNEFSDAPRWFLLNADLNPARPWNSDTEISVWAFALVKGEAPNREWLLYAQSPGGDKKDVTIDIPGYKSVMVDVTQMGSFYVLEESSANVEELNKEAISDILSRKNMRDLNFLSLVSPIKTIKADMTMMVPNKDHKSWDILQVYFRKYGYDTEVVIIDTGSGEIKNIKVDGYAQWHLATSIVAPNGKLYINTLGQDHLRQVLNVYDPETNTLEVNAIDLPESLSGETHPMVLGTDGKLYLGGSAKPNNVYTGKAQIVQVNPMTNEVVDFGEMGPAHTSDVWGYYICSDDKFSYISSGKVPWYLVSYNRETQEQSVLYEGGEVSLTQTAYGCVAKTKDDLKIYTIQDGKLVLATENLQTVSPWNPDQLLSEVVHIRPEDEYLPEKPNINLSNIEADAQGNASLWVEGDNGWKEYPYKVSLYDQPIARLVKLPNGDIFGSGLDYSGYFLFSVKEEVSRFLGKLDLSHYATSIQNNKVYLSGYPLSATFEYDLDKEWTQKTKLTDITIESKDFKDESLNPKFVGYLEESSGAHKMFDSVVGADGNIYFGGRWYRNGEGGGFSWYNPETNKQEGISDIFSNYQIRHMTTVQNGRYIVISTMGVEDLTLHKETPDKGRIFIFDTKTKEIIKTIDPLDDMISTGAVVGFDDINGNSYIVGLASKKDDTYIYNVDLEGKVKYKIYFNAFAVNFTAGDNEPNKTPLILGPKGNLWVIVNNVLFTVRPRDGLITPIGKLEKEILNLLFIGNDLYGSFGSALVKIKLD